MKNLTLKKKIFYFKKFIQIRVIEESIAEDFKKNKIFSFFHSSSGQEASAIGVCAALSKYDLVIGNHRSHGHYLAKGGDIKKLIYEIYGDSRGCCNGIGGSMHLKDFSVGFAASTPILGSVAPLACGIAASKKFSKKKDIVVAFIGDGAAEEGAFYESVNLAGLFKLPLIFVIEDNFFSVQSLPTDRKVIGYSHKNIFSNGLKAFYETTNGQDVMSVYNKFFKLKKKVLKYNKPGLLHLKVIRKFAHSGSSLLSGPDLLKTYNVKNFNKKDGLIIFEKYLVRNGFSRKNIAEIKKKEIRNSIKLYNSIRSKINPRRPF